MSHPQQTEQESDAPVEQELTSVFLTRCHDSALKRLTASFAESRPLTVLIGEGQSASRFVIKTFLSTLDEEVVVVRISEPCANAVEFMSRVIQAVGFQPKDMQLEDLESIFRMFLSFQKSHSRRTVITIEETQDTEWWVLDKIRALVELESEGQFGLMVLISGQPELKELLYTRPLNSIAGEATQRITLLPFTLAETRDYICRRVEGAGTASIEQIFDYHAVTLIHELSRGVPDTISELVSRCLDLSDEADGAMVTTEQVRGAYEAIRVRSAATNFDGAETAVNLNGAESRTGHLIVRLSGEEVREIAMRHGHVLIGRSRLCDVRIASPTVSRQHALIVYSPVDVTIVDLSSTNGTFVDGYQISRHSLSAGESIAIGDCTIEYVLDDDRQAGLQSA